MSEEKRDLKTDLKPLLASVIKTGLEITNLKKESRNEYGQYDYVSIDDYYEKVAQVAMRNGLTWIMKEIAPVDLVSSDNVKPFLVYGYIFSLYHSSGGCIENCSIISVPHPIAGAQSSGSAASYADKIFMRTLFKVRTGEPDADSTNPEVGVVKSGVAATSGKVVEATAKGTRVKKKELVGDELMKSVMNSVDTNGEVPLVNANVGPDIAIGAAEVFVGIANTPEELRAFRDKNAHIWNEVKKIDPAGFNRIAKAFIDRARALKEESADA